MTDTSPNLSDFTGKDDDKINVLTALIKSDEFKNSTFVSFLRNMGENWCNTDNGDDPDQQLAHAALTLFEYASSGKESTPIIQAIAKYIETADPRGDLSSALQQTAGAIPRRAFLQRFAAAGLGTITASITGTKAWEYRQKSEDERRLADAALEGPKNTKGETPIENILRSNTHNENSFRHQDTGRPYEAAAVFSGFTALVAANLVVLADQQNRAAAANIPKTMRTMLEEANKLLETAIAAQRNTGTEHAR